MQRIISMKNPPAPPPCLLLSQVKFTKRPQAVLWELTVLRSHYHPALLRLLPCICNPNDTHSPDPIEFLAAFDPAKVTFRPPLRRPPPHPLHALRSKRQGKRANGRPVSVSSAHLLPAITILSNEGLAAEAATNAVCCADDASPCVMQHLTPL